MNPSIEFKDVNPIEVSVPDINYIPAYKIAEEQRRVNEEQRINSENERATNEGLRIAAENERINNENLRMTNEEERKAYYNEIQTKVNNGDFKGEKGDKGDKGEQGIQGIQGIQGEKGESGVYIGREAPSDKDVNVWIDPTDNPETSASNIIFADDETLQEKYEKGEMGGYSDIYRAYEIKTNKIWIDDKPIYRRILSFFMMAGSQTETWGAGSIGLSQAETITNVSGVVYENEDFKPMPNIDVTYNYSKTNDTFTITRTTTGALTGNIIFEYTKKAE